MMARNQMTLLCFSVLFAAAVFKGYSQGVPHVSITSPTKTTISCGEPDTDKFPANHVPIETESKWTHKFVYPVEVCLNAEGLENAMLETECNHKVKHHMTTEVMLKDEDKFTNINFDFDAVKLKEATKEGTTAYSCHLFRVSEIAFQLYEKAKDKPLGESKLGAHAAICANVKEGTTPSVQAIMRTPATYYFDQPGSMETLKKTKYHAIVCGYQDCKIDIKGETTGTPIVERFNATEGKTPIYIKGATNNVAANQFSVTVYDCRKGNKCPTAFIATRVGATPGLNASFRLTIGSILVALFTLYC